MKRWGNGSDTNNADDQADAEDTEPAQKFPKTSEELEEQKGDFDVNAYDYSHLLNTQEISRFGVEKEKYPDGSGRQLRLIESSRRALKTALSAEIHRSAKAVSEAYWHDEAQVAAVLSARGVHFVTMGRTFGGETYLLPEETLFMVESGLLLLYSSQNHMIPMSVQKCFGMITKCDEFRLDSYQVFAHLRRLGYIATRADVGFRQLPEISQKVLNVEMHAPDYALSMPVKSAVATKDILAGLPTCRMHLASSERNIHSFNVYKRHSFKKKSTQTTQPDFCLSVYSTANGSVPIHLPHINSSAKQCWAVLDGGILSFFGHSCS